MSEKTDDLVAELTRDLPAVHPVARLRVVGLSCVSLWIVAVLANVLLGARAHPSAWNATHFSVTVGLGLAGAGGLLFALASVIPGRDAEVRWGWIAMSIGVLVGVVAAVSGASGSSAGSLDAALRGSVGCVFRSIAIGAFPLAIATAYLARGVPESLGLSTVSVAVGAGAMGAVAVHATCAKMGSLHVLTGHCVVPLLVAAALSWPMAALLRRHSARRAARPN